MVADCDTMEFRDRFTSWMTSYEGTEASRPWYNSAEITVEDVPLMLFSTLMWRVWPLEASEA
jgi:hypothetical protein